MVLSAIGKLWNFLLAHMMWFWLFITWKQRSLFPLQAAVTYHPLMCQVKKNSSNTQASNQLFVLMLEWIYLVVPVVSTVSFLFLLIRKSTWLLDLVLGTLLANAVIYHMVSVLRHMLVQSTTECLHYIVLLQHLTNSCLYTHRWPSLILSLFVY